MYHHLNTLTIFPKRLQHNLEVLQKISWIPCVPVVKSNAYGHGIKLLAREWNTYDIPFLCVDSLFEAYELQKHGYKKDILIMGFVDPEDIPREKRFHYACSDLDYAEAVIARRKRAKIHLFFDTGMHREGMPPLSQEEMTKIVPYKENIVGIMTHLSTPENLEETQKQRATFFALRGLLAENTIEPKFCHYCASSGALLRSKYGHEDDTLARTWLAYYGYGHPDLLPALRCHTRLMQIKTLKKWEPIGYDMTHIASKDMTIWILPIGYNDGLDRRFSNTWFLSIRETLCPIVGRVSMNITIIDISEIENPIRWEQVIFISEDPQSPISLEKQSQKIGTIPYDLLVHMNHQMYRKIDTSFS